MHDNNDSDGNTTCWRRPQVSTMADEVDDDEADESTTVLKLVTSTSVTQNVDDSDDKTIPQVEARNNDGDDHDYDK